MNKVIFLCNSPSVWDQEKRYAGWHDAPLGATGVELAKQMGRTLRDSAIRFDVAFSSMLARAIQTQWLVQEEIKQLWLTVEKDWRLNDRHLGCLQGLTANEVRLHFGRERLHDWMRHYRQAPPPLAESDPRHPRHDYRYRKLRPAILPNGESWQQLCARVTHFWDFGVTPWIRQGSNILVTSHENVVKALIRHLHHLYEEDLHDLHVPVGVPQVYEFDSHGRVLSNYRLHPSSAETTMPHASVA